MTFIEISEVLGNLGEFIGAIAVLLTLIYLAIQVKQNNQLHQESNVLAQSQAEVTSLNNILELNKMVLTNPEIIEMLATGNENPKELSATDQVRYRIWYATILRITELAFSQNRRGYIQQMYGKVPGVDS